MMTMMIDRHRHRRRRSTDRTCTARTPDSEEDRRGPDVGCTYVDMRSRRAQHVLDSTWRRTEWGAVTDDPSSAMPEERKPTPQSVRGMRGPCVHYVPACTPLDRYARQERDDTGLLDATTDSSSRWRDVRGDAWKEEAVSPLRMRAAKLPGHTSKPDCASSSSRPSVRPPANGNPSPHIGPSLYVCLDLHARSRAE
jgi:hypothetical protein